MIYDYDFDDSADDFLNYFLAGKDVSSEVNKSTAIFLFKLLRKPSFVSKNELSKIAEMFGSCERCLVDEAYKLVQLLLSNIPEDVLNKELERLSKNEILSTFGDGIKFAFPIPAEFEEDLSLFDSDNEEDKPKFSLKVDAEAFKSKAESVKVAQENREDFSNNVELAGDWNWLKQRCDFYFGNSGEHLNSLDMCSVIFDLLSSSRGNQEMQNELFELLGFDRFEFIEELLANRENVVTGARAVDPVTSRNGTLLTLNKTHKKEIKSKYVPSVQKKCPMSIFKFCFL